MTPKLGWALRATDSNKRALAPIHLLSTVNGGADWRAVSTKAITPSQPGSPEIIVSFCIHRQEAWLVCGDSWEQSRACDGDV